MYFKNGLIWPFACIKRFKNHYKTTFSSHVSSFGRVLSIYSIVRWVISRHLWWWPIVLMAASVRLATILALFALLELVELVIKSNTCVYYAQLLSILIHHCDALAVCRVMLWPLGCLTHRWRIADWVTTFTAIAIWHWWLWRHILSKAWHITCFVDVGECVANLCNLGFLIRFEHFKLAIHVVNQLVFLIVDILKCFLSTLILHSMHIKLFLVLLEQILGLVILQNKARDITL